MTEYPNRADLAAELTTAALSPTHAAVLPTASHRHILPTAQWGHLTVDGLVVSWDAAAAARLTELVWLRSLTSATLPKPWAALSRPAPPARLLSSQPADHWPRILTTWASLQPWRDIPPLWAAARILTNPTHHT